MFEEGHDQKSDFFSPLRKKTRRRPAVFILMFVLHFCEYCSSSTIHLSQKQVISVHNTKVLSNETANNVFVSREQSAVSMSHQSTLLKKMDNSSGYQERERCMVEMLMDKVVKLEKGMKDLQLEDCASCPKKCETADQERKVSESLVKNLNVKLEEMNRRQGEMQQNLLLLVETCAEFEKGLVE